MILDRHRALIKMKKGDQVSINDTFNQSFQSESNSHISTNTLEYDNQIVKENNNYKQNYNSVLEFSQPVDLRPRQTDSSLASAYPNNILNSHHQEASGYSKFCSCLN